MKTNYNLDILCKKLYRIKPDQEGIISRYKSHNLFDPKNIFTFCKYIEQYRQLHLVISLEKIAEGFPKLGIETKVPPRHKDESEDWLFEHDDMQRLYEIRGFPL